MLGSIVDMNFQDSQNTRINRDATNGDWVHGKNIVQN